MHLNIQRMFNLESFTAGVYDMTDIQIELNHNLKHKISFLYFPRYFYALFLGKTNSDIIRTHTIIPHLI